MEYTREVIDELKKQYEENFSKPIYKIEINSRGNTLIKFVDGTEKLMYKNTNQEIDSPNKRVTVEEMYNVFMSVTQSIGKQLTELQASTTELKTKQIRNLTSNLAALNNAIMKKGIISNEDIKDELEIIAKNEAEEAKKQLIENSFKAAVIAAKIKSKLITNKMSEIKYREAESIIKMLLKDVESNKIVEAKLVYDKITSNIVIEDDKLVFSKIKTIDDLKVELKDNHNIEKAIYNTEIFYSDVSKLKDCKEEDGNLSVDVDILFSELR